MITPKLTAPGDIAIYSQSFEGKLIAYEVYVIETQEAGTREIGGETVTYEAKEVLPSTEQWGKTAWTCMSLLQAEIKMIKVQGIINERRNKAAQA